MDSSILCHYNTCCIDRKSVDGLSREFLFYNLTGFLFYGAYCVMNYVEEGNEGVTRSVKLNDIAFAAHAVLLTSITIVQCFVYRHTITNTMNKGHLGLCLLIWVGAGVAYVLYATDTICFVTGGDFCTIDYLGYSKSAITAIKYIPQVWLNFKRKSTSGWSIINILLDLTGGMLSLTQQVLDSIHDDDWSVFTSNIPKALLAAESIMFDLIFILQHYVLYRHSADDVRMMGYYGVVDDGFAPEDDVYDDYDYEYDDVYGADKGSYGSSINPSRMSSVGSEFQLSQSLDNVSSW